MHTQIVMEFIKIIPSILRFLFILALFLLFYKPIKNDLIPRLTGLKLPWLEATFLEEELNRIVVEQVGDQMAEGERVSVLRRARLASSVLRGAKVLWVDDHPSYNLTEHRILHSLGIFLDTAHSTDEAVQKLKKTKYHAIISDIIREGNTTEGIDFIPKLKKAGLLLPIIYYASGTEQYHEMPKEVFAVTKRADHLVHFIIDILERVRS